MQSPSAAPEQPIPSQFSGKNDLKRSRMELAIRRRKMMRIAWIVAIPVVILVGIGALMRWSRQRAENAPGVYYPSLGQEHIALKDNPPKPYNSSPPSSGGHFSQPANWGVYDYEVNDKIFIHNLEHGGVWIAYRPSVPTKVVDELRAIVNEFGGSKIVMAPRAANDADVALAAWTRVLKFDLAGGVLSDEQKNQIRAFYRAFKNRGPEFVPDAMPGVDPKQVQ